MDEKLELKDESICIMNDIKKTLQMIYDHYRSVVSQNEYLRKENERLQSEHYKDEELTKMKEKYDQMREDYYRGFPISKEDHKKCREWMDDIMKDEKSTKIATIGGRFSYHFTPTSIGVVGIIEDSITGKSFRFQELN
jgi:regulator of replication initiation timing